MKKCNKCNIKYNIAEDYCPLCNNKLEGKCDNVIYPKDYNYISNSIFLKTLIIVSILIFLIATITEFYYMKTLSITLLVGGFLIANYLLISYYLKNSGYILELIGKSGLVVNILLIIWYLYTKDTNITNYIIPLICIFELLFNLIAFLILKKKFIFNYLKIFLLNILLLFIPVILSLLNWSTYKYFSYLCLVFGIVSLTAVIIFYFEELKEELKKIFNN